MGASQSSDEKIFQSGIPISLSQEVVNHLSDRLDSPETTPERQSVLDAHIRARIQGELERLRKDEEDIRHEIERALEKENLDKERSVVGEESERGGSFEGLRSSTALLVDLEEMRSKIDRYNTQRDFSKFPDVKTTGEAVVECYRQNKTASLDCWQEVSKFKASVGQLEQTYFKSL
ncbi:hypothetical protein K443DRAFT_672594 [Laccaria amethystina LaAM-08-1]|uniref:MICOS complex subunit MIC19 n=1 Tax=Laccaria amethystina LaAM-08-1 TaxID=1095629 RepID=A0A0C9X7C6_9AGAR|nr:hypothetical protein K443DRAFT_672594 [Laccaria amethystina LaAM-08-1]